MNKYISIKRILIIICCALALSMLLILVGYISGEWEWSGTNTGLKNLYVTHISEGSAKNTAEEKINWWHCSSNDKHYFFLPSSANLESLRLGYEGVDSVYIDGKKISNFDLFQISMGEHIVTTDFDSTSYNLVIEKSANLPTLYLTTNSGSMDFINESKDNEESGTALIVDENGDATYVGSIETIKGRGNVTWDNAEKKGYNIKFPLKEDVLGLGAAKDWTLLANAFDKSMIRNMTTFLMAQETGISFTPDSAFIDLYMNGIYWGTYQICEKIEVDENRVEMNDLGKETQEENPDIELSECERFGLDTIQETWTTPGTMMGYQIPENPTDITGGYLMELEIGGRYVHEDAGFVTTRNRAVVLQSPKYPSEEQVSYISSLYQEFEDAVYEFDGINKATGKPYYNYIDIESFSKKYLIEEVTKNLDAMITSQYLYKQKDSVSTKLFAGPVWDYDSAIGNGVATEDIVNENGETDYGLDTMSPQGLYAMRDRSDAPIWYALYYRPEFQEAYKRNYLQLRESVLSLIDSDIDNISQQLVSSNHMNQIRWNGEVKDETASKEAFLASVNEVKQFLSDRILYLDKEWGVVIE